MLQDIGVQIFYGLCSGPCGAKAMEYTFPAAFRVFAFKRNKQERIHPTIPIIVGETKCGTVLERSYRQSLSLSDFLGPFSSPRQ